MQIENDEARLGLSRLKYVLSLYVSPIVRPLALITLLSLQYNCVIVLQSLPSYKANITGCGVPEKLERLTLCEVAVATNWNQTSGVVGDAQVLGSADVVAAINAANVFATQAWPPFTTNVVAEAHSSLPGGGRSIFLFFSVILSFPSNAKLCCKIRQKQNSKVIFFIGWCLAFKNMLIICKNQNLFIISLIKNSLI